MHKGQSTMRQVKRGRAKILFNPDSENFETYYKSNRGNFHRGAEVLSVEQVDARGDRYKERAEVLKAEREAEEKKEIQKRARALENESND